MNRQMRSALANLLALYRIRSVEKTTSALDLQTWRELRRDLWEASLGAEEISLAAAADVIYFAHEYVREILESITNSSGKAMTQVQWMTLTEAQMELFPAFVEAEGLDSGHLSPRSQTVLTELALRSIWNTLSSSTGKVQGYRIAGTEHLLFWGETMATRFGGCGLSEWWTAMNALFDTAGSESTKEKPGIAVVQIMNPAIQLGSDNAAAASIFLNHMPPVKLAGAVPYFNLNIIDPAAPLLQDGQTPDTSNFSIISSLSLPGEKATDFTKSMAQSQFGTSEHDEQATHIGMEAFTTPQTLVNWKKDVLDPGRPLMSVQSFKVDIQPSRGAMSTMTAELQLTLHDRSRLSEVQVLVKPENLGKVEMLVEWGWSHPGKYTDIYANLIDSMKTSQKFMVYQSSFSVQEGGSISINLKMVTKGTSAANWTDAAMSGKLKENWVAVKEAMEAVQAVKRQALNQLPSSADIAGVQEISTLSLSSTGQLIDGETAENIRNFVKKYKDKTGDLSELSGHLDVLIGKVRDATGTLETQLTNKINCMNKIPYWADPYTGGINKPNNTWVNFYNSPHPLMDNKDEESYNVSSFASFCYHFMAVPLAQSGDYDDVQMIFYSVNKNAGWAGGMNLGTIPIDMRTVGDKSFEDLLKAEYKKYGGQYPVTKIMAWVINNFIEPQYSLCYGLSATTASKSGNSNFQISEDGKIVPRDPGSDPGAVAQANEKVLKKAYHGDENSELPAPFKPINVRIVFEVLQGEDENVIEFDTSAIDDPIDLVADTLTSSAVSKAATVLRIHILDEGASGEDTLNEVLRKFKNTSTGLIVADEVQRKTQYPGLWPDLYEYIQSKAVESSEEIFKQMIDFGLLQGETISVPPHYPAGTKESTQLLLDKEKAKPEGEQNAATISFLETRLQEFITGATPPVYYKISATPKRLAQWYRSAMPYILYGAEGTTVKNMSAATTGDSKLASFYMVKASKNSSADGAVDRGLPLRVMPISMTATLAGCPMLQFMQEYFVDMGTGSTLDNRYRVIGVTHDIKPGEYTTQVKFIPGEGYAEFRSSIDNLKELKKNIDDMSEPTPPAT